MWLRPYYVLCNNNSFSFSSVIFITDPLYAKVSKTSLELECVYKRQKYIATYNDKAVQPRTLCRSTWALNANNVDIILGRMKR